MLPQLPPDIWYRVARFSPPETLSALSQVSTTLNKVATHDTHFARQTTLLNLPVVQAYRRECGLHHPPTEVGSTSKDIGLIIRANDQALLHDSKNNTFVAFPSGYVFPISNGSRRVSRDWFVPLSHECVGFVTSSRKELCLFDLSSGEITYVPLLKNGTRFKRFGQVLLAGNQGEYILQRTTETLLLCNPQNGDIKRTIEIPEEITLVIGELSIAHDGTCVGHATTTVEKGVKTVFVHGFDDVKAEFQISEEEVLAGVLRSEDGLTHVLITHLENSFQRHFIASRGTSIWHGELDTISVPRLFENGSIIMQSRAWSPVFVSQRKETTVCVLLNEDTSVQKVCMKGLKLNSRIIWARRIRGCILALVACSLKMNKLQMVKITCDGNMRKKILKEWTIPSSRNVKMIADHFIIAASKEKQLHLLHFDKFCNDAKGDYACPLTGLSTYCYFPDQFRCGDDDERDGKRRRIDDGTDCVEWE